MKSETQIKFKHYRNLLATLKERKRSYFTKYFQSDLDLESAWKGIKRLISIKESPNHHSLLLLLVNL